ncbi:pitrilysin family protein [Chamaesiphon sp. OTE_20_metabat_361]|uniref:M16 family metallopeptidase n=1 Tax=Chamaesiphon sp. OTE_20_metabat_361 TaxID=2964689 RepID=UPI00286D5E83|nr:pitrilysin family protein [Chamaesiphon sp. OTE_20_metabat_361]
MINLPVHRSQLANGITVLTIANPSADIVSGRFFIPAGSRWEAEEQAGLAQLLTSLLTKGTDRLSALEIADRIESVGAGLGAETTADYLKLSLKTVTADLADIFKLAGEILRSPSFPEAQIALERKQIIQAIRSQTEQPFNNAYRQLRTLLYGDHPYSRSSLGTAETLAQISRQDLINYHQQHIRPDRLIISLAGRITPDAALDLVNRVFGDWEIPESAPPTLTTHSVTTQPQYQIDYQATQQAIVILGYLAPPIHDPDCIALKLIDSYLSNGMSSRLFVELREKRGLAYDVSSFYPTRLDTSHFAVYMGTNPINTGIAVSGLRAEVDRLCMEPLSVSELQMTKDKLLGQYALGKQTNGQLAQTYGWYELLGLSTNFDSEFHQAIDRLTSLELLTAADKYLSQPYISIVSPEEHGTIAIVNDRLSIV